MHEQLIDPDVDEAALAAEEWQDAFDDLLIAHGWRGTPCDAELIGDRDGDSALWGFWLAGEFVFCDCEPQEVLEWLVAKLSGGLIWWEDVPTMVRMAEYLIDHHGEGVDHKAEHVGALAENPRQVGLYVQWKDHLHREQESKRRSLEFLDAIQEYARRQLAAIHSGRARHD